MKTFKYILVALFVVFSINSAGFAQVHPNTNTATFPAGTFLKGSLQNQLSSAINAVGDKVYLLIPSNVKIGEVACIPEKSMVIGEIIQLQKAKQGRNGFIQIKFESIVFPDGWGTQLLAHIWDSEGKGILGGELTKKIDHRQIPHYTECMGTIVQLVEIGDRAMGAEKVVPAGTEFVIVLDNDLEVSY